ncbi:ATPase, T2SS/T4P/T4SS family [Sinanaerobacter sp. ZZT-01]|uniref:ATPase, T2SS/T4P/T4SS family n=1 Tax=Sinanaerobacter sp. ZZT-01 TaxID=3111540 RepID=UPI002D78CB51|nr:ATPase, T2SS/T4P/T4SS family [Sinanaerobacter sp. ZZT-01]WRR93376.1 ATPase, T2SS/T4P/T4SS family [Sinanaerobacter sp. ZZT-01]
MADRLITLENLMYQKNMEYLNQQKGIQAKNYPEIKERMQHIISTNHAEELARDWTDKEKRPRLVQLIIHYLNVERLVDNELSVEELAQRIYEDMAGFSFVEKYLKDAEVEEININGSNSTRVIYKDKTVLVRERFETAEQCTNIVQKMARSGAVILDGAQPLGDSYISKGVRMSGAISPCVDSEVGGVASIRKQKKSGITRETLIESGTVLQEELDFITTCLGSGVSMAFVGSTGSGKTSNMNYVLGTIVKETRVYTIEDTKELDLPIVDQEGFVINDVVQTYTKPGTITMNDLLKMALRFHPDIIVPAEMRGEEAMTAQEAGRTGHTIVSSLHANSAADAYDRILTMCMESGTRLSETRMLKNIVKAFPLMVFCKQLKDKSRRWMEIFEATGVQDGEVVGHSIYRFVIDHSEKDEVGNVLKVHGAHRRVGCISENLEETLRMNSVDEEFIKRYSDTRKEK